MAKQNKKDNLTTVWRGVDLGQVGQRLPKFLGGPGRVPKSQKKEKEREDTRWKKKLFGYLEGFKKSFAVLEGGEKEKRKDG